jgi:hydroxylysine kinase
LVLAEHLPQIADHEQTRDDLPLALTDVAALVHQHYGLRGKVKQLSGEVDLNFRFEASDQVPLVIKLSRPDESADVLDFQIAVLHHLAGSDVAVPAVWPMRNRQSLDLVTMPNGETRFMRALRYQHGTPLVHLPRSDDLRRATARFAAALAQGLKTFRHPAERQPLVWDMTQADCLLPMLPALDPADLEMVKPVLDRVLDDFLPQMDRFDAQVIHNDLNLGNLLAEPLKPEAISGCIDFGDMVRAPRIIELAVAAMYQIDPARPLASLTVMAQAYDAIVPLSADELQWLPDLVRMRAAMTLIISQWRAAQQPANALYIRRNAAQARLVLESLASVSPLQAREALIEGNKGVTA